MTQADQVRVEDRVHIRGLVDRYSIGADSHDGDIVSSLFVPDGQLIRWDDGGMVGDPTFVRNGLQEIKAAALAGSKFRVTMHFVGQQLITFTSDDTADGEVYCISHLVSGDAPNAEKTIIYLRYIDRYIKSNGTWLFGVRNLVTDWRELEQIQEGEEP